MKKPPSREDKKSRLAGLCRDLRTLSLHLGRFVSGDQQSDENRVAILDQGEAPVTMYDLTTCLVRTIRELERLGGPRPYRFDAAPLWAFWESLEAWKEWRTAEDAADFSQCSRSAMESISRLYRRVSPPPPDARRSPNHARNKRVYGLYGEHSEREVAGIVNGEFPGAKITAKAVPTIAYLFAEKHGLPRKRRYKHVRIPQDR